MVPSHFHMYSMKELYFWYHRSNFISENDNTIYLSTYLSLRHYSDHWPVSNEPSILKFARNQCALRTIEYFKQLQYPNMTDNIQLHVASPQVAPTFRVSMICTRHHGLRIWVKQYNWYLVQVWDSKSWRGYLWVHILYES